MKKRIALRLPSRSEKGQVIVLMALLLVGLIGAAALVADGGRAYAEQRSVQNAADNAALAAAWALCQGNDVLVAGRASAAQNGFDHAASNVNVIVVQGPASGPNAGDDEYVEAVVSVEWQPSFLQVLSGDPGPITSSARAVARCVPGSGGPVGWGNGIIALSPSNDKAVNVYGSGCLKVNGGGVLIDSSHATAAYVDTASGCPGGQPSVVADSVQIAGGVGFPDWVIPWGDPTQFMQPYPPQTGVPPRGDPLITLAGPTAPSPPASAVAPSPAGCSGSFLSGGNLTVGNHSCTNQVTVKPGRYSSFVITSDAGKPSAYSPVILEPGLYYIDGDFSIQDDAHVVGNNVTFYVVGSVNIGNSAHATLTAGSSGVLFHIRDGNFTVRGGSGSHVRNLTGLIYVDKGKVTVASGANLTASAPTAGPYAGMAFLIGRDNSSDFEVNGSAGLFMTGTVYAPKSKVLVSGSGASNTVNGQFIANLFEVHGGSTVLNINYHDDYVFTDGGGGTSLIELSE